MSASIVEPTTGEPAGAPERGISGSTGADGHVSFSLDQLHPSVADPRMDSMRLLSETVMTFPDAISFSNGAPFDGTHDVGRLSFYLDRYLGHLRDSGVPEKKISRLMFQYGPVNGFIQNEVVRNLKQDEGIDVAPEAVMITNGAQEAMVIALRALFTSPDQVLLTVSPTYVGIVGAAKTLGIPLRGVLEGPDGLDPEAVAEAVRAVRAEGKRAVALYLIPDFSNPSGASLPLKAREELLAVAAREELIVLEDNPYGLFGREGQELPTLKSLDTRHNVIYLGSYSKTAFPGVRVGFLVADQPVTGPNGTTRPLAAELSKTKSFLSVESSSVAQAVIGGILVDADYDLRSASRATADVYQERLRAVLDALAERFPAEEHDAHGVSWNVPGGGFFLMVRVGFEADLAAMERSARDYGVSWAPMSMFYVDGGGDRVIRLGFSNLSVPDIREGIARLARFIEDTPRTDR
ncbi:PLP-dependent aminotransferase family protein [Streptomyces sp. UNOC14_S4]|uniref:aminotransferase-like domain-containing protein n=1 Tax=Streptomyces sp. UNOC14_S4 TaxID=2872340 RepID=UPI001E469D4A|nr:PLP-dependent aminotransferase family protein [Streptomyces sp. UNOC14_S4]MCC3768873.1 PLP-dependent aminotransferase family protein [Streptomyces sp. UNOC14_S4]